MLALTSPSVPNATSRVLIEHTVWPSYLPFKNDWFSLLVAGFGIWFGVLWVRDFLRGFAGAIRGPDQ
jgi:hypothetical protein